LSIKSITIVNFYTIVNPNNMSKLGGISRKT